MASSYNNINNTRLTTRSNLKTTADNISAQELGAQAPSKNFDSLLWKLSSTPERRELINEDTTRSFRDQFSEIAADHDLFLETFQEVYGSDIDSQIIENLRQKALINDYSWLPEIGYVDPTTLMGADGAYSAENSIVYINTSLVGTEAAQRTFTEEIGHHLDTLIKSSDTQGDEGQLFAHALSGELLSSEEIAAIRAEDDSGKLVIDGTAQEVEFRQSQSAEANVDQIEKLLDSNGRLQWVSRGEVIAAGDLIVDDATFEELERRGLLDDFFKEAYDASHVGGGMTEEAREKFYADVAQNLSPENLIKLARQAKITTNNFDHSFGFETINEITTAVIENSTGRTQRLFAEGIIEPEFLDIGERPFSSSGEATSVARILGSFNEEGYSYSANLLLSNLSEDQLKLVTTQAVSASATDGSFPETFTELSTAVANHPDTEFRLEFAKQSLDTFYNTATFQSNGSFKTLADEANAEVVLDGITKVIDTDVVGVTGKLQREDSGGELLSRYTNDLLESGNQEKIAEHLDILQGENSQAASDFGFLTTDTFPGRDTRYGNSINLGYYLGSVSKGITDSHDKKIERLDTLKDLANFVLAYYGKGASSGIVNELAFKRGTVVASFFNDQTLNALASGDRDDIISELGTSFPDDPNGGNITHPAFDDYIREVSRVTS